MLVCVTDFSCAVLEADFLDYSFCVYSTYMYVLDFQVMFLFAVF